MDAVQLGWNPFSAERMGQIVPLKIFCWFRWNACYMVFIIWTIWNCQCDMDQACFQGQIQVRQNISRQQDKLFTHRVLLHLSTRPINFNEINWYFENDELEDTAFKTGTWSTWSNCIIHNNWMHLNLAFDFETALD